MPTQEGKGRGVGLLGKKRVMLTVTGGVGSSASRRTISSLLRIR